MEDADTLCPRPRSLILFEMLLGIRATGGCEKKCSRQKVGQATADKSVRERERERGLTGCCLTNILSWPPRHLGGSLQDRKLVRPVRAPSGSLSSSRTGDRKLVRRWGHLSLSLSLSLFRCLSRMAGDSWSGRLALSPPLSLSLSPSLVLSFPLLSLSLSSFH